eukprot:1897674-Rhodomonas_salina.1
MCKTAGHDPKIEHPPETQAVAAGPYPDPRDGLFTGETLLHILIVNNKGASRPLLEAAQKQFNGVDFMNMVQHKADGLFFQPKVIYRPHWRQGSYGLLMKFLSILNFGTPVGGQTDND